MWFAKTLLLSISFFHSISLFSQQPLANLIFYLLEPQSDVGLLTWNFLDNYLEKKNVNNQPVAYPVFKYVK